MANELITGANDRADSVIESAQGYLDELHDISSKETFTLNAHYSTHAWNRDLYASVAVDTIGVLDTSDLIELANLDKANEINISEPMFDDYYSSEIPDIWDTVTLPEFTDSVSAISAPSAPVVTSIIAPTATDVGIVTIPVWKTIEVPTEVELFEPPIDAPNTIEISDIDLTIPDMNVIVPTNTFSYEEETYSSSLLSSIQVLLSTDITEGGYGIDPVDEELLYNRARAREIKRAAKAVTQVGENTAAKGFPLPPGSLYAMERVVLQENAVALTELNRDIVLKRSDLYVAARQFAVQQGLSLEQALITYTGAKQERALKAVQMATEFTIQFHNAAVGLFNLKLEIKQLELNVHKEQLATAAIRLQEYGQKLAHIDVQDKRNQVRLQRYNQQLEAVKIFYEAQKAEENHVKLTIEVEQLRLQANQNQISVYATKVKAATDEYDLYRTAWEAEEIKQKVFTQKLAAHDKKVETVVKEAKLEQDKFEAKLEIVRAKREKQAMVLEQHEIRLRKAGLSSDALRQSNAEKADIWKTNKEAERFNIESKFKQNIEHITKYLDAEKTNIMNMEATIAAVVSATSLRSESAQAALLLYNEAVKGASSGATAIITDAV